MHFAFHKAAKVTFKVSGRPSDLQCISFQLPTWWIKVIKPFCSFRYSALELVQNSSRNAKLNAVWKNKDKKMSSIFQHSLLNKYFWNTHLQVKNQSKGKNASSFSTLDTVSYLLINDSLLLHIFFYLLGDYTELYIPPWISDCTLFPWKD